VTSSNDTLSQTRALEEGGHWEVIAVVIDGIPYHGARRVRGMKPFQQEVRFAGFVAADPHMHTSERAAQAMAYVLLRDLVEKRRAGEARRSRRNPPSNPPA
jgi:hypothetical protein